VTLSFSLRVQFSSDLCKTKMDLKWKGERIDRSVKLD
jgi:hypothetical protein